jgi:hypothetical protein
MQDFVTKINSLFNDYQGPNYDSLRKEEVKKILADFGVACVMDQKVWQETQTFFADVRNRSKYVYR